MSTVNVWLPNNVVAPRIDVDQIERDYQRAAAAQATIAELRELQLSDEQRSDIEADIARRRQLALDEPITTPAAMPEEAAPAPPSQYERALVEEIVRRQIAAMDVQFEEARQAERAFILEAVAIALGETVEVVHKRVDQLEHDLLQARGLLHENALSIRSLLPDPVVDDYAPRTPRVLARAGSRTVKERAPNRSFPADGSTPWFSEPYFNNAP